MVLALVNVLSIVDGFLMEWKEEWILLVLCAEF